MNVRPGSRSREDAPLYVGLMSGTSGDGIDACLAAFTATGAVEHAHVHSPFEPDLRERILTLCRTGGDLPALATLDVELADAYTTAVADLLDTAGVDADAVRALGAHGQTVFHRPAGPAPTSIQLGDPHRIAVRTGIDTVADFRRADVAAGGQGAPLAPGFHATVFGHAGETRAIINLGGIANITLLRPGAPVIGFDTGPANVLLDAWIGRYHNQTHDADGEWSAQGQTDDALLALLRAEEWFDRSPPKSTGREQFNLDWLDEHLAQHATPVEPRDVQATLAALTATTVADGLRQATSATIDRVLVCGGGARNSDLLRRLQARLDGVPIETTSAHGIDPQHVEPMAFAWLAHRRIEQQPGNCPSVTGADRDLVLGSLIHAPR